MRPPRRFGAIYRGLRLALFVVYALYRLVPTATKIAAQPSKEAARSELNSSNQTHVPVPTIAIFAADSSGTRSTTCLSIRARNMPTKFVVSPIPCTSDYWLSPLICGASGLVDNHSTHFSTPVSIPISGA